MFSKCTTETCEALLEEVVRCIYTVCELDEKMLIDPRTVRRYSSGTLTFDAREVTSIQEHDVPFDDCGVFENNLAMVVEQLTKFNCDVYEYVCRLQVLRRPETVMKFHQYDANNLMRTCRDTPTREYVPHLVAMVQRIRLVVAKGHVD